MERKSWLSGFLCLAGALVAGVFMLGRGFLFLLAVATASLAVTFASAVSGPPTPGSVQTNAADVVPGVVAWTVSGFFLTFGLLWLGLRRLAGRPWPRPKLVAVFLAVSVAVVASAWEAARRSYAPPATPLFAPAPPGPAAPSNPATTADGS